MEVNGEVGQFEWDEEVDDSSRDIMTELFEGGRKIVRIYWGVRDIHDSEFSIWMN